MTPAPARDPFGAICVLFLTVLAVMTALILTGAF